MRGPAALRSAFTPFASRSRVDYRRRCYLRLDLLNGTLLLHLLLVQLLAFHPLLGSLLLALQQPLRGLLLAQRMLALQLGLLRSPLLFLLPLRLQL